MTAFNIRNWTALLLLCTVAVPAQGMMTIKPTPQDHQGHQRRGPKLLTLNGFENSRLTLITPTLEQRELSSEQGRIRLKPTGMDNYHVLVASRRHNDVEEAAIRYVYLHGKPSGHSPTELTALQKTDFEIVPSPLPREHWHYKSGDTITFLLRFNGRPLAGVKTSLSTSHGSILYQVSDANGRLHFELPDDFAQTRPGHDANPPAELLLHARYNDGNAQYATWLSADYRADPSHWQPGDFGLMIAAGGFLVGAMITGLGFRNKHSRDKK